MGVPTSEVCYTPAMLRREDHEVHKKGRVVARGGGGIVYKISTACANAASRIRSPYIAAVPRTCAAYTHYTVAQEY